MNGTRITFRFKNDSATHTEEFWGPDHAKDAQTYAKDHQLLDVDSKNADGKWEHKIIGKADSCHFQPIYKDDDSKQVA